MRNDYRTPRSWAVATLCLIFSANAAGAITKWDTFAIEDSLTIQYPTNWSPVSMGAGRIDIRSSKGGAEGVGIRDGQAEIIVTVLDSDSKKSLDQVIDLTIKNDKELSRRDIKVGRTSPITGCTRLREVTSQDEIGPGTYIINTGIFCEIKGKLVVTVLRNWKNDQYQRRYQKIAEKMSKTIMQAPR